MSRFTVDSFTTASVSGSGGSLSFSRDITQNYIDILKISITPSGGTGTTQFYIHKAAARADSDLIYGTKEFDGTSFTDPIESIAGVYTARNEGFVCRYEDADAALSLWCKIVNNDASARTYNISITYALSPFGASNAGVPADLEAAGMANGLNCQSAVIAYLNNETIDEAEFRAKRYDVGENYPPLVDLRTAAEGGSDFDPAANPETDIQITGNKANVEGSVYAWISADDGSTAHGRWYFAWRMHNSAGWSKWTDGNDTPLYVYQFFDTTLNEDSGPPSGWQVTTQKGSATGYWIVHATRPETNGNLILWWTVQLKDASTGTWREVDANAGAAVTKYDGSGADHTYDLDTGEWKAPVNWGTAAIGDLIVYDVRGDGNWALEYCQWSTVQSVAGDTMYHQGGAGNIGILETATRVGNVYTQIRAKVVKPPWDWSTEGYLGGQLNRGMWDGMGPYGQPLFDTESKEFVSEAIYVPPAITDVEARVWFQNGYSRSDDGLTHSGTDDGGSGIVIDGFLWTRFSDRNWWIPVIQQGDNVSLDLNADGSVTGKPNPLIASGTNDAYGWAGVMSRFRLFPNQDDGKIVIRAKFAVDFEDLGVSAGGKICGALMLLDMEYWNFIDYGTDRGGHAFGAYNMGTSGGTPQFLWMGHVKGWDHDTFELTRSSHIYDEVTPMPGNPFYIELRLTIDEDYTNLTGSGAGGVCVWQTYEYQIDGGGWNTIVVPSPSIWYERWSISQAIKGYRVGLIYYQESAVTGCYVKMKEFSIISGYAARM